MPSIAVSQPAAIPDPEHKEFPHCDIFSRTDKLQGPCFPVLHHHFCAVVYPDILIFTSTLLTTSVHLFFHLQHSGQLTRDLKGSFFSRSSNITDRESISSSTLLILPRTYTAIHEEKGSRACYRDSQRHGCIIPLQ